MKAHQLESILNSTPTWKEGGAEFWLLDSFSGGNAWVGRYSGRSPWELHRQGEEFFHILRGRVEFTLLSSDSTHRVSVGAGEIFIVPRNMWHCQNCEGVVVAVGATTGSTEHSVADDPRIPQIT
jgi:mannose-6-phosphate isomerase-like protein (cupin superfamily)